MRDLNDRQPSASPPPGGAGTVLHVEDSPTARHVRRRILEAAGFRVIEAAGERAAWEALLQHRPDVVLTDIMLPDGDGYALTHRIKAHLALAQTRVVQVSAEFTDADHRIRGLDSGADAYIIEPANAGELAATVRSMVRGRRTEQLLQALLDSSPLLITGADADGRVAVFNPACEALTGYARAEILGQPFVETLVSPADRQAVAGRFRTASAAELALPHENAWRTASGNDVLIEWRCFPASAPDGGALTIGIGEDVTARKSIETALRESESRFREMAETSPVMIWVTDARGSVEFVNQAYRGFFGVREEDLRGPDGWKPLVHPDDVQTYAETFYACLRDGLPFYAEARMRRQDGQWRWIASDAAARLAADGRIIGYAGSSPDITEMKEAVAQVREAMKVKDEFLASVAHELRQPINAALAALGLMRAQHDTDTAGRASVVLERQLRQMSRVVDDLLDASRIVRGDVALELAEVDLRGIVRDALDTVAPAFDERGHHVEVALPDSAILVRADAARIQQVLVNVLSNAAKYTPEAGTIRIAMHRAPDRVAIHVRDSGIGIPPEALTRIFDLFARSAAGREHRGFGIGLAVARQLIEQHGGTIEARSEGSGAGSEFIVSLPVHRQV